MSDSLSLVVQRQHNCFSIIAWLPLLLYGFRTHWIRYTYHWKIIIVSHVSAPLQMLYYMQNLSNKDPSTTRFWVGLSYGIACKTFPGFIIEAQFRLGKTVGYASHVNIEKTFKMLAMMSWPVRWRIFEKRRLISIRQSKSHFETSYRRWTSSWKILSHEVRFKTTNHRLGKTWLEISMSLERRKMHRNGQKLK